MLLAVVVFTQITQAQWFTNMDEAKKMAAATNKILIVDFWATWCGPCKKMDFDSWNDDQVNFVLNEHYIKVKVDIDSEKGLANEFSVNSIPNMFILDANGKTIYNFSGYKDAKDLKRELLKYAFSTAFMEAETINFRLHPGFNTSIRLAQKYLDYSCLLPKDVKKDYVEVANKYLAVANKFNDSKNEDFKVRKEKLEFLKLYDLAYMLSFDKLQKKLVKIDAKSIDESNLPMYQFLNYIVAKGLKDDVLATKIIEESKSIEDFEYFVDKTTFILTKNETATN